MESYNDTKIFYHDVIDMFFWRCFDSLVKFSSVNIITGPEVMIIFFYKGLPKIRKSEKHWTLDWVWDAKFGPDVANEMLLNAAKYQGYSFYRFWITKWKPTRGWV